MHRKTKLFIMQLAYTGKNSLIILHFKCFKFKIIHHGNPPLILDLCNPNSMLDNRIRCSDNMGFHFR